MKRPIVLLLLVSLGANAVLALALFRREPGGNPATSIGARSLFSDAAAIPGGRASLDLLRAALANGDQRSLEAAGLSPELARDIVLSRTFARFAASVRAMQERTPEDPRWWRRTNSPTENREEEVRLRREFSDVLMAVFGDDFDFTEQRTLAFLSPSKRIALRRVMQDYEEMEARFATHGLELPSEQERLRVLKQERDRDTAAMLTPQELAEYEMRQSPTASRLVSLFGEAIETEEEFRKLFALQKAFDDRFPRIENGGAIPPDMMPAAQRLQQDMRAAVGEERYAAMRRASDYDLHELGSLVTRLNLPAGTLDRIAAARESVAADSQRINANASLPPSQRLAELQALATRAKAELAKTLGSEAGEVYAGRSAWLGMLKEGSAFTTTPWDLAFVLGNGMGGVPGVFAVPPPNATPPGKTSPVSGSPMPQGER